MSDPLGMAGWLAQVAHPVAVGLHAAAPLMLLVMVEAGRAVLLRRISLAAGTVREGIPRGRWVLSPWRTWLLWRRMVLWRITSYDAALEVEARLRRAHALLLRRYGRRRRRETPADLVWMLRSGLFVEEAFARVDALLLKEGRDVTSPVVDDEIGVSAKGGVAEEEPDFVGGTENQFQEVIRINELHWATCGRPVSAETVRKHLRVGAARARALTHAARAGDIAAVTREAVAVE
jgi:hypothetical protein